MLALFSVMFLALTGYADELDTNIVWAECMPEGTIETCFQDGSCESIDFAPDAPAAVIEAKPAPRKKPAAPPNPHRSQVQTCDDLDREIEQAKARDAAAREAAKTSKLGYGFGRDPIILGALDRSLIDEVIKRHMNQIRYCYQRDKELKAHEPVGGKVRVRFTINKDGTVSSASVSVKCSDLQDTVIEDCLTGRFSRMQFPQPKGGGIVIQTYPFFYSP